MKQILFILFMACICQATAQTKKPPPAKPAAPKEVELKTKDDTLAYLLGMNAGQSQLRHGMSNWNSEAFKAGMEEYKAGKAKWDTPFAQNFVAKNEKIALEAIATKNEAAAEKFLTENKLKPGVIEAKASGIQIKEVEVKATQAADGKKPVKQIDFSSIDQEVYYELFVANITLKLMDGSILYRADSMEFSRTDFPKYMPDCFNQWQEYVWPGKSYIVYFPPSCAYGTTRFYHNDNLRRIVPPNALVICEVKILSGHILEVMDVQVGDVSDYYHDDVAMPVVEKENDENTVLSFAQEMPAYPGGDVALIADIANQIVYPQMEKENEIEGTVYVEFVVEKDGSISNIKAIREVKGGPGLTKEALRAMKSLPKKFTPAKQNGIPVRLRMTWPVKFRLQ
ncbi:MAG: TonB family protein [Flavobacteriales bacterium]